MNHADQKDSIFRDDQDWKRFIQTLAEACGKTGWQVLAWWTSELTTVSRRWASERLRMGDESRVTQAIRRVKAGGDRELRRLRAQLEKAGEDQG